MLRTKAPPYPAPSGLEELRRTLQDRVTALEPHLLGRLRRRLAGLGRADADDAMVEVRLRLDRQLLGGKLSSDLPTGLFAAYVRGVARRVALELLRTHVRQRRLAQAVAVHAPSRTARAPSDPDIESLADAVDRMDDADAQVARLMLNGAALRQIAACLSATPDACRGQQRRVLAKLKVACRVRAPEQ